MATINTVRNRRNAEPIDHHVDHVHDIKVSLNSNWARTEEDKEMRRGMHAWLLERLTEDLRTEMGGGKQQDKTERWQECLRIFYIAKHRL
jgi:hypothetical protein